jgi:copper homeostasis protein CutC
LRRPRIIIAKIDSDLLTELMNKLADARVVLDTALSRLPDTEQALKENIETTIKEIESSRLKVLKLLLDDDSS